MGRPARLTPPAQLRALSAAGLLCLAAGALPAAAADAPRMAGPAQCRFAVPPGWPERGVGWSGPCRAGLAQGRGALRAYDGGKLVMAFYGTVEAGQPVLGVVDLGHGFVAGRFEAGRASAGAERNTLIEAFDAASAAARQLAEGYRKAGNAASARFYENKAKQLAAQMD